jgi:hypothetical protein
MSQPSQTRSALDRITGAKRRPQVEFPQCSLNVQQGSTAKEEEGDEKKVEQEGQVPRRRFLLLLSHLTFKGGMKTATVLTQRK